MLGLGIPFLVTAVAVAGAYRSFERLRPLVVPITVVSGLLLAGFGLLTGAFTEETTFVDWDWRSKGDAFGLPLFQRDSFLKELRVTARLKELAARYEKSVAQLAIAWVLGNPAVTVALVGMRNEKELQENVAAANWTLTPDDRAEIDRIFAKEGVPTYVDAEQAV